MLDRVWVFFAERRVLALVRRLLIALVFASFKTSRMLVYTGAARPLERYLKVDVTSLRKSGSRRLSRPLRSSPRSVAIVDRPPPVMLEIRPEIVEERPESVFVDSEDEDLVPVELDEPDTE